MVNKYYELFSYDSREALVRDFSKDILNRLQEGIKRKGYATMALSGGSTPKKLFQALSKIDFPWKDVKVTLVDERWVDPQSEQSNEKLVRDFLLGDKADAIDFLPLKMDYPTAQEAVDEIEEILKDSYQSLDVIILGMGLDAHTASLFPHTKSLPFALTTQRWLCVTNTESVEPKERITLSRHAIISAENLFLHLEGKEKKDVFMQSLMCEEPEAMPIISVMEQKEPLLKVYYAD